MADQRQEPTLSSSALDFSDAISTQRAGAKIAGVKRQSSLLLWLSLIIALLAVIGGVYLGWQLFNAQQLIYQQQQRLHDLEAKFAVSDGESTQSLTVLSANLRTLSNDVKLALSEVDKLWATRNVNRKSIGQNKEAIAKAQRQLAAADTALRTAVKTVEADISGQKKAVGDLQKHYAEQQTVMASLGDALSEQEILVQSLRERMALAGEQQQAWQSLTAAVSANAEAVTAFDAFRRTVNQDLLLLKQRLGAQ
ncbi:MAG: hypothetical protein KTR20_02675 [Cellvibrionaceae bacterium]|nr:hypothetical protein [Cellvibrionaceae bacterium]